MRPCVCGAPWSSHLVERMPCPEYRPQVHAADCDLDDDCYDPDGHVGDLTMFSEALRAFGRAMAAPLLSRRLF